MSSSWGLVLGARAVRSLVSDKRNCGIRFGIHIPSGIHRLARRVYTFTGTSKKCLLVKMSSGKRIMSAGLRGSGHSTVRNSVDRVSPTLRYRLCSMGLIGGAI